MAAAMYYGKAQAIPMLIGLEADPNASNGGLHPHANAFHNAVCSGSLDAAKAGAKAGALDTAYQASPLVWAEYFVSERRDSAKQDVEILAYLQAKEQKG